MANQLYTKEHLDKRNVYPKNYTENIFDKESGKALPDILNSFNCYFLSYFGDKESTRLQVPLSLRKEGLWITYVDYNHIITIEYYNANRVSDEYWSDSSNWRQGSNLLVGELSISSNGNWVIDGIETEYKAQGERGITPLIRYYSNNKLQASYDEGRTWQDISNEFENKLKIKKYISATEDLPLTESEGTIYMQGPFTDSSGHTYYKMWVYAWKDNVLGWQENGEFNSIAAGVTQEYGDSPSMVMSQKAVKDNFVFSNTIRGIDTTHTQDEIEDMIEAGTADPNILYLAFENE